MIDPANPDPTTLDAAIRLARLHDRRAARRRRGDRRRAIRAALSAVRTELEAIKGIKATLTSIAKSTISVQAVLEASATASGGDRRGRGGDPAAGAGLIEQRSVAGG